MSDKTNQPGTSDKPRVRVFIDGQNLFKGLSRVYKVRLHPLLLARELAGPDRQLVGAHYYSGIHDRDVNQNMFELVKRRHDLIRQTGVAVTERTLRYNWEWRVDDDLPSPWRDDAPKRQKATVKRYQKAREKGIDVALALDAVASALTDEADAIIIVSRDRDLMEIASEITERCGGQPDKVKVGVEVAFVTENRGDERALAGYDHRHQIDKDIVDAAVDHFNYGQSLDDDQVKKFLAGL